MLIIGSVAMNRWFYGYRMNPADTDYIATFDEVQDFIKNYPGHTERAVPLSDNKWMVVKNLSGRKTIHEFEIAWSGSSAEMILREFGWQQYAHPDLLLAIKLSHRYLKNSPHFLKTMDDIKFLRENVVDDMSDYDELINLRESETYTYKHPNLNQSKKNFFSGDGVTYLYDHDSIHESVALEPRVPAYMSYIDGEVMFSKEKFLNCSHQQKLNGVVEESMVLAIERSLVPFPGAKTAREAFLFALEKVCTSITSGIFREFAWENYHNAVDLFDESCYNYWTKFQQDVDNGLVKLFHGE